MNKRFVYRGGNWNNGTNAGVFSLNGNNSRANSNGNVGFRCAYYYLRKKILMGYDPDETM